MKLFAKVLLLFILTVSLNSAVAMAKITKIAKMNFRLDQVQMVDETTFGNKMKLNFDVYLERPDLGLKEPKRHKFGKNKYTVDLPLALQPRLMYVSDLSDRDHESGDMCDRPRFPHRCEVDIAKPADGAKPVYEYLLKVTFEDGAYAEKKISVPYVGYLDKPNIIAPTTLPSQGDKFNIQFKDVSAKEYEVSVSLCKPYNNDGIDPCLDGVLYYLKRRSTGLVVLYQEGLAKANISTKDGVITLQADFPLNFEVSVEYMVKAVSYGGPKAREYKINTYFESVDYKTFPRKN